MESKSNSIIILGATGAVGNQVMKFLMKTAHVKKITTLGRSSIPEISEDFVFQHKIDVFDPNTYGDKVLDHQIAICTFGVGEPSKISKEDFVKIDKVAVLNFAKKCREAGVNHFQLLSSVGINADSFSFFLRTKGELVQELEDLKFQRLSIFQPSMILTPTNRYGLAQALTLKFWPLLTPILIGRFKKYRGVKVEDLGRAFVRNIGLEGSGVEMFTWKDIDRLSKLS